MKFGIYVPNFGEYGDALVLAGLAAEAEACGWDGFFIWDQAWPFESEQPLWAGRDDAFTMPPMPLADTWVSLTAIALRTERIRFGPLVTPMARRRPQNVARAAVTVDRLSGGRLTLGAGIGAPADSEFARFGEDSADRVRAAKLDEALDIVVGLWSGASFTHDGAHYQIRDVTFLPGPIQEPSIPIWVAGVWPHPRPMRRAARFDGVFPLHVFFEQQPLLPDDYRSIGAYVAQHRSGNGPFDMVYAAMGLPAAASVPDYEAAGVTWWLEGDTESVDATRKQIRQGPPN